MEAVETNTKHLRSAVQLYKQKNQLQAELHSRQKKKVKLFDLLYGKIHINHSPNGKIHANHSPYGKQHIDHLPYGKQHTDRLPYSKHIDRSQYGKQHFGCLLTFMFMLPGPEPEPNLLFSLLSRADNSSRTTGDARTRRPSSASRSWSKPSLRRPRPSLARSTSCHLKEAKSYPPCPTIPAPRVMCKKQKIYRLLC